jgi:hypothetical protein
MHHSLQQLQLFMNDFTNAAFTSIQLFTLNRTTYVELYEKRLSHLKNALDCFQQVKADTDQAMMKIHRYETNLSIQLTNIYIRVYDKEILSCEIDFI